MLALPDISMTPPRRESRLAGARSIAPWLKGHIGISNPADLEQPSLPCDESMAGWNHTQSHQAEWCSRLPAVCDKNHIRRSASLACAARALQDGKTKNGRLLTTSAFGSPCSIRSSATCSALTPQSGKTVEQLSCPDSRCRTRSPATIALEKKKRRRASSLAGMARALHDSDVSKLLPPLESQCDTSSIVSSSTSSDMGTPCNARNGAQLKQENEEWEKELVEASGRFRQAQQNLSLKPWNNINAEVAAVAEALHAERIRSRTAAIVEHLVGVGETTDTARELARLLRAEDDQFSQVFIDGELNSRATDTFRQKVKTKYENTLRDHFPNWRVTDAQKKLVINRCLKQKTFSQLCTANPDVSWYADALCSEVERGASEFHCPICLEPLMTREADGSIDTSRVWFAPHRKTEHWSNNPCGHACCRHCMAVWADTAINEQRIRIKCPAEKCSYNLWDQDLKDLVSEESFARHQEHKHADYLKHLRASVKNDKAFKSWLQSHARPCPECHVIVSRSEGCNVMVCVCGTRFCYACGFKDCKCKKKDRPDIWNPVA